MFPDQQSLAVNGGPSTSSIAAAKPAQMATTTLGSKINLKCFLDGLARVNPSASILSIELEHLDKCVPQNCLQELPTYLSTFYDAKYKDYHELLSKSSEVYDSLNVDAEQAMKLEELTRKQANSKL